MQWTLFDLIASSMPVYLGVVGALCCAGGIWLLARRLPVIWRGRTTMGTIIAWERQRDSEDPARYFHFPRVRYRVPTGAWHEVRIGIGYDRERWPVGANFSVRFDPANPDRCYASNPLIMFAGRLAFLVLGGAGLYAGLSAFK